ncbi:hypothetical protein CerSpe_297400 [Prunus speciosa]
MDQRQKGSEAEHMNQSSIAPPSKSCTDCHTTTTPLWRGGPAGPRTLCNACGIKYRKRKRALVGLNKGATGTQRRKHKTIGAPLKLELMSMEREMVEMVFHFHKRKLKEEEEAAILLMALSCSSGTGGAVYA